MLSRDQQDIEWLECHGRRKNGSPIKIVVDSLTCSELAHEMTKLPDLIKSLKKVNIFLLLFEVHLYEHTTYVEKCICL